MIFDQRNESEVNKFKTNLLSSFKPDRSDHYGIDDRVGLRYSTQVRIDLNPFRKYKLKHNFGDTSDEFCSCGDGIEDSQHYLFDCHWFLDARNTFWTTFPAWLEQIYATLVQLSL